jgi:hypothetical protein
MREYADNDITVRVAVDIVGEDEQLRQLLRRAEALATDIERLRWRREPREQKAAYGYEPVLCDSDRMLVLHSAIANATGAARDLAEALIASGAITDEPLF